MSAREHDPEPLLSVAAVGAAEMRLRGWAIPSSCVTFVRVMSEQYPTFDVVYFLEKPWKWSREFALWTAAGSPAELTRDLEAALEALS